MFNATASWMPTGIQNLFLRYLDRKSNIQSLFEKVRSLSSAFRKLSSDEYQESVLALRATVDDRFNKELIRIFDHRQSSKVYFDGFHQKPRQRQAHHEKGSLDLATISDCLCGHGSRVDSQSSRN